MRLAISPCPNDTFLFAAALHNWVDTEGLNLDVHYADIDELNSLARNGSVDVVKISYFTYAMVRQQYQLLDSGSALGRGVGPLVVSRHPMTREQLTQSKIAIPGWGTTAHLLLQFYAPELPVENRNVRLFHDIMPAVAAGQYDAGLIIHESRFTYPQHGLHLVQDLGTYWEQQTGLPIPLGGIVAKHDLGEDVHGRLNRVIRRSAEYAFANEAQVMPYVRQHAQEMDEAVMRQHIELYVNQYSISLGDEGHAAINRLMETASTLTYLVQQD